MTDKPTADDGPAEAVYRIIRERLNPFGKTWSELTEEEKAEPRMLAKAASLLIALTCSFVDA